MVKRILFFCCCILVLNCTHKQPQNENVGLKSYFKALGINNSANDTLAFLRYHPQQCGSCLSETRKFQDVVYNAIDNQRLIVISSSKQNHFIPKTVKIIYDTCNVHSKYDFPKSALDLYIVEGKNIECFTYRDAKKALSRIKQLQLNKH